MSHLRDSKERYVEFVNKSNLPAAHADDKVALLKHSQVLELTTSTASQQYSPTQNHNEYLNYPMNHRNHEILGKMRTQSTGCLLNPNMSHSHMSHCLQ